MAEPKHRCIAFNEHESKVNVFFHTKSKTKFNRVRNGPYGQFTGSGWNVYREFDLLRDKNIRLRKMNGKTVKDHTKSLNT